MSRVIRYHYHRPGKGTTVFEETVVLERSDVVVALLPRYTGASLAVRGECVLQPGAPIMWFLFPGEWYGVGRFHLADGTFTGWYTNLTEPVRMEDDDWYGTDLFLDYFQPANGGPGVWLDEDELAAATLTRAQRDGIEGVRRLVTTREWPPAICRERF